MAYNGCYGDLVTPRYLSLMQFSNNELSRPVFWTLSDCLSHFEEWLKTYLKALNTWLSQAFMLDIYCVILAALKKIIIKNNLQVQWVCDSKDPFQIRLLNLAATRVITWRPLAECKQCYEQITKRDSTQWCYEWDTRFSGLQF